MSEVAELLRRAREGLQGLTDPKHLEAWQDLQRVQEMLEQEMLEPIIVPGTITLSAKARRSMGQRAKPRMFHPGQHLSMRPCPACNCGLLIDWNGKTVRGLGWNDEGEQPTQQPADRRPEGPEGGR